jgi:integrase
MGATIRMPYLQFWKGTWRVRKPVPKAARAAVGRSYLTRSLGTANRTEANRLAVQVIAEFLETIRLAEVGEWPPIDEHQVESTALKWYQWFVKSRGSRFHPGVDSKRWALVDEAELEESLDRFILAAGLQMKPGSTVYRRIQRACRIIHHEEAGGYAGQIERRWQAQLAIGRALDDQKVSLEELATYASGRPIPADAARSIAAHRTQPCRFRTLLDAWERERQVGEKTRYSWERIAQTLVRQLGHDDAARVTEDDVIEWKNGMVQSGLALVTIRNHLTVLKALYNYAVVNKLVVTSPAAHVRFLVKRKSKTRRGYTDEEARLILLAAREEPEPHKRWVPWLCAFTGARLDEICGAMASDVETVASIPCLHIRPDNRKGKAPLKNETSERTVPLHSAVISEGFFAYLGSLPKDGPLFPNITPDRFGRRGGNGTKTIGRWIRRKIGLTDPKIAPNHSWRHRFKTVCRAAGIAEENHDYLTGHANGDIGREYGFYELPMLGEQIARIRCPI